MKKQQNIELINGAFSASLAHEIIIDLINKKIQFHKLKLHENWEKNTIDETSSLKRITELEAARSAFLEFISIHSNDTFNVQSNITIESINAF
ncbi:MAG: hypothetical protein KA521_06360 [Crocinitomicaceae bacterium]|nr:hypothetical protein [Crocinitomicaceae bacterium]